MNPSGSRIYSCVRTTIEDPLNIVGPRFLRIFTNEQLPSNERYPCELKVNKVAMSNMDPNNLFIGNAKLFHIINDMYTVDATKKDFESILDITVENIKDSSGKLIQKKISISYKVDWIKSIYLSKDVEFY